MIKWRRRRAVSFCFSLILLRFFSWIGSSVCCSILFWFLFYSSSFCLWIRNYRIGFASELNMKPALWRRSWMILGTRFSLSYCSVSKTHATIQQHGPIIRYGRTWALIIEDRGKIWVQACWILKKKKQKMIGKIRLLLLYWIEYVWEDKSSEILFFLLLWGHDRSRRASFYKLFRKGHQRTMDRGYSNMCMLMKVTGWWVVYWIKKKRKINKWTEVIGQDQSSVWIFLWFVLWTCLWDGATQRTTEETFWGFSWDGDMKHQSSLLCVLITYDIVDGIWGAIKFCGKVQIWFDRKVSKVKKLIVGTVERF